MTMGDGIVLLVIAGILALAVRGIHRSRQKGCPGCCAACSRACAHKTGGGSEA